MLKVYFAGSIRGGRADAEIYAELISYIQKNAEVLTEHIGNLDLSALERELDADRRIYLTDTAFLNACDMVIAECTCPSLGVGYELAYAEAHKKPCHILYRKSRCSLSAMLKGDDYFHIYPYETIDDAHKIIDVVLNCNI